MAIAAAFFVIANRALEILGYEHGDYKHCDPHDHVNLSQSTNDAYPTFAHIGLYLTFLDLTPHLDELIKSLRKKAKEFRGMLKIGRTQLQDAVPMTHEQTFNGFASILEEEIPNLEHAAKQFLVLNMGSTAIGTGICSQPGYREAVIKGPIGDHLVGIHISRRTCSSLEHIDAELISQLALADLIACLAPSPHLS